MKTHPSSHLISTKSHQPLWAAAVDLRWTLKLQLRHCESLAPYTDIAHGRYIPACTIDSDTAFLMYQDIIEVGY